MSEEFWYPSAAWSSSSSSTPPRPSIRIAWVPFILRSDGPAAAELVSQWVNCQFECKFKWCNFGNTNYLHLYPISTPMYFTTNVYTFVFMSWAVLLLRCWKSLWFTLIPSHTPPSSITNNLPLRVTACNASLRGKNYPHFTWGWCSSTNIVFIINDTKAYFAEDLEGECVGGGCGGF